jgi:hypothetical protein
MEVMSLSEQSTKIDQQDRLDITELLSKWGLFIDSRRFEDWWAILEPDASIDIAGGPPIITEEGKLDIARNSPRGVHISAPPVISAGPVAATAQVEQSFFFYNIETKKALAGHYEDVVVKRAGRWYLSRRSIRFF